jgi:hypothetical protein
MDACARHRCGLCFSANVCIILGTRVNHY